jgi:hypothetical protein
MGWKQDLRRLDASFPRGVLSKKLGISSQRIGIALAGKSNLDTDEKWRIRKQMEKLRGEHAAAHEVAIYALQMAYQLCEADEEEREKVLDRCVPMLEYKIEALTARPDDA